MSYFGLFFAFALGSLLDSGDFCCPARLRMASAAATRDAIHATISEERQADARAPIFSGRGKLPDLASL